MPASHGDVAGLSPEQSREQGRDLLHFLTCGSVDDGKSTLIGRLLYDTHLLLDDQLAALRRDSIRHGTDGANIDFALLVDGLEAEREQGITIDVAYRYFSTARRKFIVADTPGHEQFTRNMATGASNADLAVVLVDARKGVLTQTRRHSYIASLLGIRHVVLAVNKMDLVGHDQITFDRIAAEYRAFASAFAFETVAIVPISARHGDNVIAPGDNMAWYEGPSLLDYLETIEVGRDESAQPFRLPVQWVNRPDLDFRGYAGTIASGCVRVGDAIHVAGSGRTSIVRSIVTYDGDLPSASAGDAVTLTLADEIDISRGDMLSSVADQPAFVDQLAAHVIWMHEEPLIPGRSYLFKIGTRTVSGSVTAIKHSIDVNSLQRLAAKSASLNEVVLVNISLGTPVPIDPYADIPGTGAFIIIDRLSNLTVGAGMIDFALRRAANIQWQSVDLTKQIRSEAMGQRPVVLWFTGLSGAGKSTIANLVERRLFALGHKTYLLDGDNVRHGLNRDLGFTAVDRVENVRRVAEVAKLFVDAGLIVLASLISPFRSERLMARELFEPGEFVEVYVETPLQLAETRDPKGLYKKARAGLIKNFTGIDSPYDVPEQPELRLTTETDKAENLAEIVFEYLKMNGYLD